MYTAVLTLHIIVAIVIIGLILIQHGKGADAGASFGAGSAGTVFGAAGSANFLTRTTAILTAIFFITSLALASFARREAQDQLMLDVPAATMSQPMPMPHSMPTATLGAETALSQIQSQPASVETATAQEAVDVTQTTDAPTQ